MLPLVGLESLYESVERNAEKFDYSTKMGYVNDGDLNSGTYGVRHARRGRHAGAPHLFPPTTYTAAAVLYHNLAVAVAHAVVAAAVVDAGSFCCFGGCRSPFL